MKFLKIRDVRNPNRGTELSAGIDFYIPKFSNDFLLDVSSRNMDQINNNQIYIDRHSKTIVMSPNSSILIPSGIVMNLIQIDGVLFNKNEGVMLMAANKSSVSVTMQLDSGANIIDQDYQGEIHLSVNNASNKLVFLSENKKLIQFILVPILLPKLYEIHNKKDLYNQTTSRSENGFGSTGN